MNVLAELQKRARIVVILANHAKQQAEPATDSQNSQDSQGGESKAEVACSSASTDIRQFRAALLTLADAMGLDHTIVHRLTTADLADCAGFPAEALRAYLLMLDDTATRRAGKIPKGDTATIHCAHCGPVFAHPATASVLPIVDGWPRALGCPWCFIRKAGLQVPRPEVTCSICEHFQRAPMNLEGGVGRCILAASHSHDLPTYPGCARRCGSWHPKRIGHER